MSQKAGLIGAIVGAGLLIWAFDTKTPGEVATPMFLVGLVLFGLMSVLLMRGSVQGTDNPSTTELRVKEWPYFRFLRKDAGAAPLYLGFRLFLAYEWIEAGLHKLEDPKWTTTYEAITSYWQRATAVPEPPARALITYDWYRDFLSFLLNNNMAPLFSWVVMLGEVAIGLGLFFGCLTAFAAGGGLLMNFLFLFAGTTSSNPLLVILQAFILFGWAPAGWWGLDRFLLLKGSTPTGTRADHSPRHLQTAGGGDASKLVR